MSALKVWVVRHSSLPIIAHKAREYHLFLLKRSKKSAMEIVLGHRFAVSTETMVTLYDEACPPTKGQNLIFVRHWDSQSLKTLNHAALTEAATTTASSRPGERKTLIRA
jgi:hypothetical protein